MRANFGFIVAGFMLLGSVVALPVEGDVEDVDSNGKDVAAIAARPMPNCKSRYLVDMCLNAKDTGSYCDNDGNFYTKIPACIFPNCFCE
ncbi:hypothetical protein V8F20_004029 [Naviculisporaceae sp. PSN 640]